MKHKHAEMICAKAANMELVVFCYGNGKWFERACGFSEIRWWENRRYFLCLPQHKEVCLHWLNGGEYQVNELAQENMLSIDQTIEKGGWCLDHWFMSKVFTFRIKSRKEKRWIGVWRESVTPRSFESRDSAEFWVTHNSGANQDYWQFIEIEIEIEI